MGIERSREIVKKLAAEGKLNFDESTGDIELLGKTPEENDKILNIYILNQIVIEWFYIFVYHELFDRQAYTVGDFGKAPECLN